MHEACIGGNHEVVKSYDNYLTAMEAFNKACGCRACICGSFMVIDAETKTIIRQCVYVDGICRLL